MPHLDNGNLEAQSRAVDAASAWKLSRLADYFR